MQPSARGTLRAAGDRFVCVRPPAGQDFVLRAAVRQRIMRWAIPVRRPSSRDEPLVDASPVTVPYPFSGLTLPGRPPGPFDGAGAWRYNRA